MFSTINTNLYPQKHASILVSLSNRSRSFGNPHQILKNRVEPPDTSKYRSISFLLHVVKLLEDLISAELIKHLKSRDFLSEKKKNNIAFVSISLSIMY